MSVVTHIVPEVFAYLSRSQRVGEEHLVGMLTQADVALNLPDDRVGDVVEYISA